MANTAQVNQPLIEHPLPWGVGHVLGASATLVKGAAPNTDSLLVPPPATSPNGAVARSAGIAAFLINNSGIDVLAGGPDQFFLIYKAEGALEAIMSANASALAAGDTSSFEPKLMLLAPTDRGIFLRLGDLQELGSVDFTGTLDAYMSYFDRREQTRVAVNLTTVYQTVLSGAQGKSRMLAIGGEDNSEPYAVVSNFDSIDHTIEARLSDGVNTIQLPAAAVAPVVAGTVEDLDVFEAFANLQEGWSLQLRTTVDVVDRPCRAILAYTDTNLSPVRTNQGGAF